MKRNTLTAFLLLALQTIVFSAELPGAIEFSSEVTFVKIHDPGYIVLKLPDGSLLDTTYTNIEFETLYAWEQAQEAQVVSPPRKMQLTYNNAQGVEVRDIASGEVFRLNGVMEQHPIDLAAEKLMEIHFSTLGMKSVQSLAQKAWRSEMNRALEDLGGEKNEPLSKSQAAWETFREAQVVLLQSELLHRSGTMFGLIFAVQLTDLIRDRANVLKDIASY